jgi:hypothetical protein
MRQVPFRLKAILSAQLTVTAFNTTQGEYAATTPQTITVATPSMDRLAGLFNQYVAAGFHHDRDGAGDRARAAAKNRYFGDSAFNYSCVAAKRDRPPLGFDWRATHDEHYVYAIAL